MRCSLLGKACWRHAVPRFRHQLDCVRCCSHQLHSSERKTNYDGRASNVFRKRTAFTLERATDTQLGLDHQLWDTGAFQFSVYPDLPKIMHWSDMLKPR